MATEGVVVETRQEEVPKEVPKEAEAPKGVNDDAATPETVVLKSADGQEFDLDVALAMQSGTIRHMIEDGCAANGVPLPNVTSSVLSKVILYWNNHAAGDSDSEELKKFDRDFIKMDRDEMFEVIMAANYLEAKALLDLTCQAVADSIKDMTVEEVRDYFNIENDFTPEEEAKIRSENSWAFDD